MALPPKSREDGAAAIVGAAWEPPADVRGSRDPGFSGRGQVGSAEEDRPTANAVRNQVSYTAFAAPAHGEEWWSDSWSWGRHWGGDQWREEKWHDQQRWWNNDNWSMAPSSAHAGSQWRGVGESPADTLRGSYLARMEAGLPEQDAQRAALPPDGPPETWATLVAGPLPGGLGAFSWTPPYAEPGGFPAVPQRPMPAEAGAWPPQWHGGHSPAA